MKTEMKEITPGKWWKLAVGILTVMIMCMALLTYIVDPYFHFHGPIEGISYRLYDQQYINDGIARHFDYDTIIIGNSLSENVQASQVDELFDCKSIKIPYSGAGYKELWESIERALKYNPDVKQVWVFMDTEDAARDKDYVRYTDYPEHLYDNNVWNDVKYLWNKDVFYKGTIYNLLMTFTGKESTTFDEYSTKYEETGADIVVPMIGEISDEEPALREYTRNAEQTIEDNINTNIIPVVQRYPDVEFMLIYAPISIAKWARYYSQGELFFRLESNKKATECLMEQDNIFIYSFQDDFDLLCNLDYYRDTVHYSVEACKYMVERIAGGEERVTDKNYQEYYDKVMKFYTEYDYRSLVVDN